MVSASNLKLALPYIKKVVSFKKLPQQAQLHLCEYWDVDKAELQKGCRRYAIASIPVAILSAAILVESVVEDSFEEYHAWYVSNGRMPDHNIKRPLWPCHMSQMKYETLEDGWHRFHDYVRKGVKRIPCILVLSNKQEKRIAAELRKR
jgi:hypothetical protein